MALSNDLISSFVKVAKNDSNKKKTETTVYGTTVKRDGRMWVKIDGSELLTPISSTAEVRENERVTVMVKNHTATITGNMSSPAVRTGTVDDVKKIVDESVSSISYMYALGPSSVIKPTEGWTTEIPPMQDGMYMWQMTIATLNTGATKESDPICLTGASGQPGEPGSPGAPGRSVVNITDQFCLTNSRDAKPDDDALWQTRMPDWSKGDYLWVRSVITYENPTGVEYTEPRCDCSWEAVNDVADDLSKGLESVDASINRIDSSILKLDDQIISKVEAEYVKSTEFVDYKADVSNTITQSVNGVRVDFNTVEQRVDSIEKDAVPKLNQINEYIKIENGDIILGNNKSPVVLRIENDKIAFSLLGDDGKETRVCYITDSMMAIKRAQVTQEFTIGDLRFYMTDDGSYCIN